MQGERDYHWDEEDYWKNKYWRLANHRANMVANIEQEPTILQNPDGTLQFVVRDPTFVGVPLQVTITDGKVSVDAATQTEPAIQGDKTDSIDSGTLSPGVSTSQAGGKRKMKKKVTKRK